MEFSVCLINLTFYFIEKRVDIFMKRFFCFLLIFSLIFGILTVGAENSGQLFAPDAFQVVSTAFNSVNLSWAPVDGASGYVVYKLGGTLLTYQRAKVSAETNCTVSSLATGTTYSFKVVAYETVDGKNIYGAVSEAVLATPILGKTYSGYATATSPKGSTKLSWAAVDGATGYVVYRSFTAVGGYERYKVAKSTSYVTAGRLYCYKVAAYRTVNGVNVYGKPSEAFYTPEIPVTGMTSKMPGATILQAWKIEDSSTGTSVVVQKLSYGSPIGSYYEGRYYSIPQVCFIAVVTCSPDRFGCASALKTLNKTGLKKGEGLVNDIALKKDALVAINNEGYSGHWNFSIPSTFLCDGPVVKDGMVVQNRGNSYAGSAIYKNGTWLESKTISPTNVNSEILKGLSYTQTSCSAVLWNGVRRSDTYTKDTVLLGTGSNALKDRTFYAQVDANHYLLVVGEFMQISRIVDILQAYGAKKAFKCNGGNCSYMYLKGVGNVTGTAAPQLVNLNKLNVLEQEWLGNRNLINGGKGAACPAVDIIYVN